MLFLVSLVTRLQSIKVRPLLDKLIHSLFSGGIVQHLQKLARNRLYLGFVLDKSFHARREVSVNKFNKFTPPTFVELADDGDILNLFIREFAVGAVDLSKDIAGINEENAVVCLGLVEEPERGR